MRSIRDIFRHYMVDWHRRVDPAWAVEMISGTLALLSVLLVLLSRRSSTIRGEAVLWIVALSVLSVIQIVGAVIGNRNLRAFGCLVGLTVWTMLAITLGLRYGTTIFQAGPITMSIASCAACLAYYVSTQPTKHG